MKRYAALFLCIIMVTSSFAAEAEAQAAPAGSKPARRTTKKTSTTAEDLAELKAMLQQQQQQINQLQQQVQQRDQQLQATQQQISELQSATNQAKASAAEAKDAATSIQSSSSADKESLTRLSSDVKDIQGNMTTAALQSQEEQKRVSAVEGLVGRFRFSGDVRVRQEDFFQSHDACPSNGASCNPRVRERIRARFNILGKLNDDFVGGISLASGTVTDPTSTNETLTSMFEKKTFALDRAFITYNPSKWKWLSITGGKFAATWIKTNQTFDPDLNPEGFSEKISYDVKSPILKNVSFTGIQLLYNEVNRPSAAANCLNGVCISGGSITGGDSYAAGGQASAKLQVTKRWSLTPAYTILNWHNNDVILNQPTGVTGSTTTSAAFGPNGITNATVTVGTAGGQTIRRFYSQFLYSDLILDNTIKTNMAKFPVRVLIEYLDNLNAQDHPLLSNGTVATDLGRQSHVYRVEATIGQQTAKGDLQFTYSWHRQEQDSVLASFDESDQRAPTNILQHMFIAAYRVRSNTTLQGTVWLGRTLNSALQNAVLAPGITAGQTEPYLKRMQFDVVYSF